MKLDFGNTIVTINNIDLNIKIENFMKWCYKKYILTQDKNKKNDELVDIINTLEKIAICAELKYNNSVVNNSIPYSPNVTTTPSYIDKNIPLINCLTQNELKYLKGVKAAYPEYVRLITFNGNFAKLYLNPEGKIIKIDDLDLLVAKFGNRINAGHLYESLINENIKDVIDPICDLLIIKNEKSIKHMINRYDAKKHFNKVFNRCVLYRIIDRGGKYVGPRRALLVAKELNLDIDIPMIYGYEQSDKYFSKFIAKYLSFGGNDNLVCYVNYFDGDDFIVSKKSINDILKNRLNILSNINNKADDKDPFVLNYSRKGQCLFSEMLCSNYRDCYSCIMDNKNDEIDKKIKIKMASDIKTYRIEKKVSNNKK